MATKHKFHAGEEASKSLNNVSAAGPGKAINVDDYESVNWLIVWTGLVTLGAVVIESAHDANYGGTWNALTSSPVLALGNAAKGGNFDFPPGGYVRARISTGLIGGTVTVYLNAIRTSNNR